MNEMFFIKHLMTFPKLTWMTFFTSWTLMNAGGGSLGHFLSARNSWWNCSQGTHTETQCSLLTEGGHKRPDLSKSWRNLTAIQRPEVYTEKGDWAVEIPSRNVRKSSRGCQPLEKVYQGNWWRQPQQIFEIQVEFTVQADFTRRPIGCTCGMVLELSDSYDNFPQFHAEFNCVLESNIWVMDIV